MNAFKSVTRDLSTACGLTFAGAGQLTVAAAGLTPKGVGVVIDFVSATPAVVGEVLNMWYTVPAAFNADTNGTEFDDELAIQLAGKSASMQEAVLNLAKGTGKTVSKFTKALTEDAPIV